MIKKTVFKNMVFPAIAVVSVLVLFTVTAMAASAPRLNLFPKDVTEYLSNTGETAKAMENSLKDVIGGFDQQLKLYNASGCEGSTDPGCEEIAKQMGEQYSQMLSIMKESLPEMKYSVMATNKGIEKNLRSEIGKKTTPADIQRMMSDSAKPKPRSGRFSLSKRFAQYHNMISSGQKNNLAALAAEIYLDSKEVINMIDLMEAEIAQQEVYMRLGRLYGTLTPEMTDTVGAVKNVIFGEEEGTSSVPIAPGGEPGGYSSPLERQ